MSAEFALRDPETAEFRAGLERGDLLLRHCRECGTHSEPRILVCPVCRSPRLEYTPAAGTAEIVSWTVAYGRPTSHGAPRGATWLLAALAEGPWWFGELFEADEDPCTGAEVRVEVRAGAAGPVAGFVYPDRASS
jgi:uncharacterized OB-fold protein